MSIYSDNDNIGKVITCLKWYFKDRIKSTYKYRDKLNIESITFDDYFQLIKTKKITKNDNIKVRLNDQEIDNLLKYLDYYFGIILLDKEKICTDAEFLIDILNHIKIYLDFDSEEIKEIYKYLICLDYLKNDLIHKDFTGTFKYKGNELLQVIDFNEKPFVKYSANNSSNYIMACSPVYFIDKLNVLDTEKYSNYCLYDKGVFYLDVFEGNLFSKNFHTTPLNEYLENKNITFLIKDYYKDLNELKHLFEKIKNYKEFCKLNNGRANEWALKLLLECSDKDYTDEQKENFINILSSEILKELFFGGNYVFMADDRIEDSPITSASLESNIPLNDGAILLEIQDGKAIIERGYKALQKIYY